jgi:hypothetical protein
VRRAERAELSTETLVRYLQGDLTRSESEETERQVADSRRAQERLGELRAMMDELGRPPDWAASVDLVGALRGRLERAPARRPPRRALRWAAGGGARAAAAVLALVALPSDAPAPEVRSKGAAAAGDPDRWVGIQLARPHDGGAQRIEPGARLGAGELQVSYTNLGPQPYSHLMVFAVDVSGRVSWLYPAYEEEGTSPPAIAIERGVAERVLPDLVEHDFAAGRLAVCGLFLRRPLTVGAVEAALGGQQPAPGYRLPFPNSGQHCLDLETE